jgi:Uncharacterized protein conserved in archaea
MIDLLKFDLNGVKTVVNPIFGLPTPHQQSVIRVLHGAQMLRRVRAFPRLVDFPFILTTDPLVADAINSSVGFRVSRQLTKHDGQSK